MLSFAIRLHRRLAAHREPRGRKKEGKKEEKKELKIERQKEARKDRQTDRRWDVQSSEVPPDSDSADVVAWLNLSNLEDWKCEFLTARHQRSPCLDGLRTLICWTWSSKFQNISANRNKLVQNNSFLHWTQVDSWCNSAPSRTRVVTPGRDSWSISLF